MGAPSNTGLPTGSLMAPEEARDMALRDAARAFEALCDRALPVLEQIAFPPRSMPPNMRISVWATLGDSRIELRNELTEVPAQDLAGIELVFAHDLDEIINSALSNNVHPRIEVQVSWE